VPTARLSTMAGEEQVERLNIFNNFVSSLIPGVFKNRHSAKPQPLANIMNKHLSIIIFLFLNTFLFGQEVKTVPYLKERVYQVNLVDSTQKILIHEYTQDTLGNETSYCNYNFNEYLPFEIQKESANKVKEKGFRDYEYLNNRLVKTKVLDSDSNLIKQFVYLYDADGKVILVKQLNSKNELISQTKYKYNKDKNLIEEIIYNEKNRKDYKIQYKYSNGMLSEQIELDFDGRSTIICKYTYNQSRSLIIEEWSDPKEKSKEYTISFYHNGFLVRKIELDTDGTVVSEYKTTYYENGLEKTWKKINPFTGEIIEYQKSEYDY